MTTIPSTETEENEISMDEEQVLFNKHLDNLINCDGMRTHRLPEDEEGMDSTNQIPTKMPKFLLDSLNGVTKENPEGTHQLVHVRLPISMVNKLTTYGKTIERGYQTLIKDLIQDFIKINNL